MINRRPPYVPHYQTPARKPTRIRIDPVAVREVLGAVACGAALVLFVVVVTLGLVALGVPT